MTSRTRSSTRCWACHDTLPAGSFARASFRRSMKETIADSLLFPSLGSAAGRKRRGPGKAGPQWIPDHELPRAERVAALAGDATTACVEREPSRPRRLRLLLEAA